MGWARLSAVLAQGCANHCADSLGAHWLDVRVITELTHMSCGLTTEGYVGAAFAGRSLSANPKTAINNDAALVRATGKVRPSRALTLPAYSITALAAK